VEHVAQDADAAAGRNTGQEAAAGELDALGHRRGGGAQQPVQQVRLGAGRRGQVAESARPGREMISDF
jgi:hypothetical protein